jgi:hypothetical protein
MGISGMMLNKCETAEPKTLLPFPLPAFFFLAKVLQRAKKIHEKMN